jgi:hypothetical protein
VARLKPEHLSELRRLYELGQAIVLALASQGQIGDLGAQFKRALDGARDTQNVRGMRSAVRDLGDMLSALPDEQRRDVTQAVAQSTGTSLQDLMQADARAVAGILRRGHIRNQKEYHLLQSHLDRLVGDAARSVEAASIVDLLESYRAS